MLLARYALAIIDSERICARRYIEQLEHSIAAWAPAQVRQRAERLVSFAEMRQRVRLDDCLLPALHAAMALGAGGSPAERGAVRELEELARLGGAMLPGLHDCLRLDVEGGDGGLPRVLAHVHH